MIINKNIRRTIQENKSQYFGSVALIITSCLFFTMFNLLAANMGRIFDTFSEDYHQEDASFIVDQRLENIPELEQEFNVLIEEAGTFDYSVTEEQVLRIFSENEKVNLPAIIEGNSLSGGDILLDPAYAKANHIKRGDSISVYDRTFQVSGFMSLPNYIYPLKSENNLMSDPKTFGIAVISKDDFNAIGMGNRFYSVKALSQAPASALEQLKARLNSSGNAVLGWTSTETNPRVTMVTTKMSGINKVSSVMPVAILLLSCILTGIVLWRMIKREAVIIGTLYALGYRKKEIRNHYLRYPFVLAVTGGITGTLLGSLLLSPMLKFMLTYFNMPMGKLEFSPVYVVISILLPLVFLSLSGYLVVRRALRKSPLELMRGTGEETKVGFLERNIRLDRFTFPVKFKIREQLRSIARSTFLLFGVVLATMLLLLGFTSKSSLDNLMNNSFEEAFRYNYSYVFNSLQRENHTQGEAFSEIPFTLSSGNKDSITIYGVSPASRYVKFNDLSGKSIDSDRIIITKGLAERVKVRTGDTLTVRSKLDSKEYTITVDSIANSYVGNYIYMPLEQFNRMLGLPADSYMGLWSDVKLELPKESLLTTATRDDIKNAFQAITAPIQSLIGVMSFLAFIIGLIVIYVVTSLMIEENKANISLLKILGYRKKEVYSMILNSSSYCVILGYLLGIPAILFSLGALYQSLTREMNLSLPITINPVFLIIGFVIIFVTYEVSKAFSKRKVNRITMNEVLKARFE